MLLTILNINENKIIQQRSEQEEIKKDPAIDSAFENISMENATYLQNMEDASNSENLKEDESNMSTFEVDSIELATPELFSEASEDSSFNQDNNTNEPNIFDNAIPQDKKKDEIKELEMFEDNNQEEDFEIPAFLRRQKN